MIKTKFIKKSRNHDYMMLSRYIRDVDYYLGYGQKSDKCLFFGNAKEQIIEMFKLYNSLTKKPNWINKRQLNKYRAALLFAKVTK